MDAQRQAALAQRQSVLAVSQSDAARRRAKEAHRWIDDRLEAARRALDEGATRDRRRAK
jgi:hypothetical protein